MLAIREEGGSGAEVVLVQDEQDDDDEEKDHGDQDSHSHSHVLALQEGILHIVGFHLIHGFNVHVDFIFL